MLNRVKKQEPKARVQFDLSPRQLDRQNKIMYLAELATRKELFNNAISLFEWAVNEAANGKHIASIDASTNEYTPLLMPAFSAAARRGSNYQTAVPTSQDDEK